MSILLPGSLGDVHPSAQNKWLIKGSKWFDVDTMALGKALKNVYKNYKTYIHKAKQQGNFAKENFSFEKMKELLGEILDKNVTEAPKRVELKLPKLQKVGESKKELPKLQLPKLQKI